MLDSPLNAANIPAEVLNSPRLQQAGTTTALTVGFALPLVLGLVARGGTLSISDGLLGRVVAAIVIVFGPRANPW